MTYILVMIMFSGYGAFDSTDGIVVAKLDGRSKGEARMIECYKMPVCFSKLIQIDEKGHVAVFTIKQETKVVEVK